MCLVLFEMLQVYDVASLLHWIYPGGKEGKWAQVSLPAACGIARLDIVQNVARHI